MRAKRLPFFECGLCGLAYIDKKLLKKVLREWKEGSNLQISLSELYKTATQTLKQHIKYSGLKLVQFNKNPPQ